MIIDWPDALVVDVARRRVVLVLGSGISRQSENADGVRPKMWAEFLEHAIRKVPGSDAARRRITKLVSKGDLLTACEIIKRELGNADFHALLREEYLDPRFAAAPIHDSIINLDARIVTTPNFDKIYESHINHVQKASVAVKRYYDDDLADAVRGTGRVIIKIHGTVDQASEMIFTRTEYARARSKYHSFYRILEALTVTHTFLFLGCGLEDPDIRLLLEDYAFLNSFGRPHYFVLHKSQIDKYVASTLEVALNIRILTYDARNNHQLLPQAIDELVGRVDAEREKLATTLQW